MQVARIVLGVRRTTPARPPVRADSGSDASRRLPYRPIMPGFARDTRPIGPGTPASASVHGAGIETPGVLRRGILGRLRSRTTRPGRRSPDRLPSRILVALLAMVAVQARAAAEPDLFDLPIADLVELKVTSASKRLQSIYDAPAAIYVISRDDIERSGLTTLPEILRLAPGLEVARISGTTWAVSARGFNSQVSRKLLVLIDGRTIFSHQVNAVYWEGHDLVLEDIDRIEVIRGPGGTLWGANAVNGVINIITRDAADTHGTLVSAGYGNQEQFATLRQGGSLGDRMDLRIYAKYFESDRFPRTDGATGEAFDALDRVQGGFRFDWRPDADDHLTVQGDVRDARHESRDELDFSDLSGVARTTDNLFEDRSGNVLARWSHVFGPNSDLSVQTYFDRVNRPSSTLDWNQSTVDVELEHRYRFDLAIPHELIWGGSFRVIWSRFAFTSRSLADWVPAEDVNEVASGYVQDQVTLVPDSLYLTAGVKAEWNDVTGWEPQPNLRLSLHPADDHIVWAAYSRAVRTPARGERDIRFPTAVIAIPFLPPVVLQTLGNKDLESETSDSFEAGYRAEVHESVFLDVAAYYTTYDDLVGFGITEPFFENEPETFLVIPNQTNNEISWETWGVEATVQWKPTDGFRLGVNYTYFDGEIDFGAALQVPPDAAFELPSMNPSHQVGFRAGLDLPHDLQADLHLFVVDELRIESPFQTVTVDAYTRLDLRIAWSPVEEVSVAAVGQNLLSSEHDEFIGTFGTTRSAIPRTYYGSITLTF